MISKSELESMPASEANFTRLREAYEELAQLVAELEPCPYLDEEANSQICYASDRYAPENIEHSPECTIVLACQTGFGEQAFKIGK